METAVVKANAILSEFISSTSDVLAGKLWHEYRTYHEVSEALRLHRIRSKFSIPDPQFIEGLDAKAKRQFIEFNDKPKHSMYHFARLARFHPELTRARAIVHEMFDCEPSGLHHMEMSIDGARHVEVNPFTSPRRRFFHPEKMELVFSPGESAISSGGDVSPWAKLFAHRWTVTRKALPLAIRLIKSHRTLRRIVYAEGLKRCGVLTGLSRKARTQRYFEVGLAAKVAVVSGSRLSTVEHKGSPNEKRRLINVEPLLNMFMQQEVGNLLNRARERYTGQFKSTGQSLHRQMIRACWETVCTVDESRASDSTQRGLVQFLFPAHVVRDIDAVRSGCFECDGVYHRLNVQSLMGNATTFPILTIVTYALAKACSDLAFAYGDDSMVRREHAKKFMHVLRVCGYSVNEEKSFTKGDVLESCGGFTFRGEDIVSYDIKYCQTELDIVNTCNKLLQYVKASPWQGRWFDLWSKLINLVPDYWGPSCRVPLIQKEDHDGNLIASQEAMWVEMPAFDHKAAKVNSLTKWLGERSQEDCFVVTGITVKAEKGEHNPSFEADLLRIQTGMPIQRTRRSREVKCAETSIVVTSNGMMLGTVEALRRLRTEMGRRYATYEILRYEAWLSSRSVF